MSDNQTIMTTSAPWPYKYPSIHEAVSGIIQRRSTNSTDVRDVAFDGVDLSHMKNILDLGCGFGFNAEALAKRVASDAHLIGIDAWGSNREPFVEKVTAAGRQADFLCMKVGSKLPYVDKSFDLVVCSYSLYFFVDIVPEVARVLTPDGLFLTITHSESSVVGQLPAAGFGDAAARLLALTRKFSAENGSELLSRSFGEVACIDYRNYLCFKNEHVDELLTYLRFKLPHLVPGAKPGDELPDAIVRFVRDRTAIAGELIVEKNDAVFRCWRPLCH